MVQLKQLLDIYLHGALNIKYEPDSSVASIGDTQLNVQQAQAMCANLGWESAVLGPFEIIDKTKKFMKALKCNMKQAVIWQTAMISFDNKASNVYGKTFDRIHMVCPRQFEISILYKMPGNTSSYVIYNSLTSVPIGKCKSMKQVAEFIDTLVS